MNSKAITSADLYRAAINICRDCAAFFDPDSRVFLVLLGAAGVSVQVPHLRPKPIEHGGEI
jgi:hypothetical protein